LSSAETSLRNCASGLRAPFRWFFSAILAVASRSSAGSTPYFLAYAGRIIEYIAAAVMGGKAGVGAGETRVLELVAADGHCDVVGPAGDSVRRLTQRLRPGGAI